MLAPAHPHSPWSRQRCAASYPAAHRPSKVGGDVVRGASDVDRLRRPAARGDGLLGLSDRTGDVRDRRVTPRRPQPGSRRRRSDGTAKQNRGSPRGARTSAVRMVVGATGFEPATSCSRSRRSTGLSYAPIPAIVFAADRHRDAPERTRTSNLLIRSQMLYPIELRALTPSASRSRGGGSPACLTAAEAAASPANLTGRPAPSQASRDRLDAANERYKTRTCDLHDVNVAL